MNTQLIMISLKYINNKALSMYLLHGNIIINSINIKMHYHWFGIINITPKCQHISIWYPCIIFMGYPHIALCSSQAWYISWSATGKPEIIRDKSLKSSSIHLEEGSVLTRNFSMLNHITHTNTDNGLHSLPIYSSFC